MNMLVVVLVIGALLGFGFGFIVGDAHGWLDGRREALEMFEERLRKAPFAKTEIKRW